MLSRPSLPVAQENLVSQQPSLRFSDLPILLVHELIKLRDFDRVVALLVLAEPPQVRVFLSPVTMEEKTIVFDDQLAQRVGLFAEADAASHCDRRFRRLRA